MQRCFGDPRQYPSIMCMYLLPICRVSLFFTRYVSVYQFVRLQIPLISSLKKDQKVKFTGDARIALAIVYVSLAVSNFISPSVISVLGTRISMVLGSITYA